MFVHHDKVRRRVMASLQHSGKSCVLIEPQRWGWGGIVQEGLCAACTHYVCTAQGSGSVVETLRFLLS